MPAFAFGADDRYLSSSSGASLIICSSHDSADPFQVNMTGEVRGIRHLANTVLCVDSTGLLAAIDGDNGEVLWSVQTGVEATRLVCEPRGSWAVMHDGGIVRGQILQVESHDEVAGVRDIAFDHAGGFAWLTGDALVYGDGQRVAIPNNPNSLCWSALGWWLVATDVGLYRLRPGESEPLLFLKMSNGEKRRIACSADGRVCAFLYDASTVCVFGVEIDINCGAIQYPSGREVCELDFGPHYWLGLGLGEGDGNKVNLLTGAIHRTDPPPGQAPNRWLISAGVELDEVPGLQTEPSQTAASAFLDAVAQIEAEDAQRSEPEPPAEEPVGQDSDGKSGFPMWGWAVLAILILVAGLVAILLGWLALR